MLFEHTEWINGVCFGIWNERIYNVSMYEKFGENDDEPESKYMIFKGKHFADCIDKLEKMKKVKGELICQHHVL